MARANRFTPTEDAAIYAMREAGASWRAIGQHLGRSHRGCRARWIALRGVAAPVAPPASAIPPAASGGRPRGHDPLLAGDWRTWGAITVGTVLEGSVFR
jgi:hypothetical protein